MAPEQKSRNQGMVWLPLIIGVSIGATVAATTGQWWWATVGAVIGGVVGAVGANRGGSS